jgi:hypothetical protein
MIGGYFKELSHYSPDDLMNFTRNLRTECPQTALGYRYDNQHNTRRRWTQNQYKCISKCFQEQANSFKIFYTIQTGPSKPVSIFADHIRNTLLGERGSSMPSVKTAIKPYSESVTPIFIINIPNIHFSIILPYYKLAH